MKITTYKYFEVHEEPLRKGRKTSNHYIINLSSGALLGEIKWYGAWRQYCFFPSPSADTVWSTGCLDDIKDYIKKLKEK